MVRRKRAPLVRAAAGAAGTAALSATLSAALGFAPARDVPPAGKACWATHYGPMRAGARTASGQLFDNSRYTAATSLSRRPQLPFGTRVKVTNVANGRSLTVRITDRGAFAWTRASPKCLDLTDRAFARLGGVLDPDAGLITVREKVLRSVKRP
ncbi:septal ring lytic transglycosylase RlpA family protein [Streptomyces himastatinicus]|uniref:septal ring lytic transglycosylase RlpA family protein n=1 Tax=Streptomyces himastatinicus TaxID=998084 RepID=UPI0001B4DE49|nr:septal ring lytic transglycosylase RlpA family protein [Streptomyces himastatinicus]